MTSHSRFRPGIFAFVATLLIIGAVPRGTRGQQGPQAPAPAEQPQQPAPPSGLPQKQQTPPPPQTTIAVQSNIVNVDAIVTDQDGNLVTGLQRENFHLFDNGQQQEVINFAPTEQPLTIVMLVEFSARYCQLLRLQESNIGRTDSCSSSSRRTGSRSKPSICSTTLQVDFTQDKREVDDAHSQLGLSEFQRIESLRRRSTKRSTNCAT